MKAHIAFLLYGVFSGANFIFMKWGAASISPMQVAFVRVLFGFIPLALMAWHARALSVRQFRDIGHFLTMGLVATAFYFFAITRGTALLPSGLAAVLANANMLFTALLSLFFLKDEKFNGLMVAGVVLGFLGIVLIARPWEGTGGSIDIAGVFWVLLSTVILGASFVYVRVFLTPRAVPPLALATWQMGIAVMALALVTDFHGLSTLWAEPWAAAGLIIGAGVIGTGLTFFLYYHLVNELGAVAASSATYLAPAVALLIAWAVGEHFGLLECVALAMIAAGVGALHVGRQRSLAAAPLTTA
jgi:drug/metabolite transporter (DMT)-like permease